MALRVWLPLNGTLENKGTSDDIAYSIASGNSFTSNGKICNNALKLTKIQQILGTTSCMTGAKEVSYAFWVKVNTAWSTNWLDGIRWISTDGTSTGTERQEFYENCTLVGTWYRGGAIYGGAFTPGVWTHLAATINYNTGEACFYVNGDLKGTTSNVDTTYYCRGDFYIGDNGVDILQNDVRIYDHCLSAKEVKEISQGLVLHYKLDGWSGGAGDNIILTNSDFSKGATDWSNWATVKSREIININNKSWAHIVKTANAYGGYSRVVAIKPNTAYTVSATFYASGTAKGILWWHYRSTEGGANLSQASKSFDLTTTPQRYSAQIPIYTNANYTIDRLNLMIGTPTESFGDINIYFTDVKIEEGNVDTSYSPAPQDLGIDTTKITDSSGYGNDGTVTGTLSTESDFNRYEISTHYSGSSYTDTGSGTFNWFDFSQCTLSAWIKPTASVSGWSGSIGVQHNQSAGHKGFTITDYANNFRVVTVNGSYTTIDSGKPLTIGEWHHCAAVLNGTNLKMYYDGTMVKESTISWGSAAIATDMRFATGVDFPGTDEKFTGNYSDVRMYCTALSAEDILDLYHTSANVDDLGNLHGFEFVSAGENLVYNANIAISGALDRNAANGVRLYSQTNCISSFEDNYIRIYRPPNIIHDSSTMHNMWGGLRLRNSSVGSIHVYNSSTDNIFNLQKGHTYVMYFTVKGKSTNAATSIGWTNDMGWGGGGLLPTPSNVEYLYTPVNFNGEMDCFYKFTISDDIVKTCTNSYGNFVAGNKYMSYCDFMYGFGYENTGSLGTDVKVNNLRLYDITSASNSDITLSGIVNSLSFVEDDYTTAKIRRYGEILENLIIEK